MICYRDQQAQRRFDQLRRECWLLAPVRRVVGGSNDPKRIELVIALRWWAEVLA